MATTFNVISLGRMADLDRIEGNSSAEGASDFVGQSFGSEVDPLCHQIQTLSPGTNTYRSGANDVYDLANPSTETFRIDDGPDQVFDGVAGFWATITYVDGTTAQISAVLFQDTAGNTYLAPEYSDNSDQAKLEAKPIQSLSLDQVAVDSNLSGLVGDRETGNFMVCFVEGTQIDTVSGLVPVEKLNVGDLVRTVDNGSQAIRWIGSREVAATDPTYPVRISAGALGTGLPSRELQVSQQHRLLTCSRIAKRMFGQSQVLIAAKKLVGLPGITLVSDRSLVAYWHILCDRHEIVLADGAPAETLFTGKGACAALGRRTIANIKAQCPELASRFNGDVPARLLPAPKQQKAFARRLLKNGRSVIEERLPSTAETSSIDQGLGRERTMTGCNSSSDIAPMASNPCMPDMATLSSFVASANQRV